MMLFTHTDLPLPVLPAAVSCQNTSQGPVPIAQKDMPAYIDEVLHLVEFCNGDAATTEWGAKRAAMGHPEPFNLEYLGIGNEDLIDDVFRNRFQQIFDAVKATYPDIVVVGTVRLRAVPTTRLVGSMRVKPAFPSLTSIPISPPAGGSTISTTTTPRIVRARRCTWASMVRGTRS